MLPPLVTGFAKEGLGPEQPRRPKTHVFPKIPLCPHETTLACNDFVYLPTKNSVSRGCYKERLWRALQSNSNN